MQANVCYVAEKKEAIRRRRYGLACGTFPRDIFKKKTLREGTARPPTFIHTVPPLSLLSHILHPYVMTPRDAIGSKVNALSLPP